VSTSCLLRYIREVICVDKILTLCLSVRLDEVGPHWTNFGEIFFDSYY
jgi:hypothetical protein